MCKILPVTHGTCLDVGEAVALDVDNLFGDTAVAVGSHGKDRRSGIIAMLMVKRKALVY